MLDYVDRLEDASGDAPKVIGWYHTHPGSLDVFMSPTDQETQRRLFNQTWHFSLVLNPQRQEYRVYYGADSAECRGQIVTDVENKKEPLHAGPVPPSSGIVRRYWPRRLRWVSKKPLRSLFVILTLGSAITVAFLFLPRRPSLWRTAAGSRRLAARDEKAPPASAASPSGRSALLRVTSPARDATFFRGTERGSPPAMLRLLPGDTLRIVTPPHDGWVQVEL